MRHRIAYLSELATLGTMVVFALGAVVLCSKNWVLLFFLTCSLNLVGVPGADDNRGTLPVVRQDKKLEDLKGKQKQEIRSFSKRKAIVWVCGIISLVACCGCLYIRNFRKPAGERRGNHEEEFSLPRENAEPYVFALDRRETPRAPVIFSANDWELGLNIPFLFESYLRELQQPTFASFFGEVRPQQPAFGGYVREDRSGVTNRRALSKKEEGWNRLRKTWEDWEKNPANLNWKSRPLNDLPVCCVCGDPYADSGVDGSSDYILDANRGALWSCEGKQFLCKNCFNILPRATDKYGFQQSFVSCPANPKERLYEVV